MNTEPKSASDILSCAIENGLEDANSACLIAFARAIQLDAHNAALRKAAEVAGTNTMLAVNDWSDYCKGRQAAAKAILSLLQPE